MRRETVAIELIGLICVVVALIGVDWRLGLAVLGVALIIGAATADRTEQPEEGEIT